MLSTSIFDKLELCNMSPSVFRTSFWQHWHPLAETSLVPLLEALATEAYREGKISHSQLRRLLGLQTRTDVDAFLKDRGVELEYTAEDLERDRETLKRFGV